MTEDKPKSIAELFGCKSRRARRYSHNAEPPAGMKSRKRKNWIDRRFRGEFIWCKQGLGHVDPDIVRCAVEDNFRGVYHRRRENRLARKRAWQESS